jgi:hypothetical protein
MTLKGVMTLKGNMTSVTTAGVGVTSK